MVAVWKQASEPATMAVILGGATGAALTELRRLLEDGAPTGGTP